MQNQICSEAALEAFFNDFGPSARSAYTFSSALKSYFQLLLEDFRTITFDTLDDIIRDATSLDLSRPVSQRILLIAPGDTRDSFTVNIPTYFIYQRLREHLDNNHTAEAAARLFDLFVRNKKTKASAGYLLDDAIHGIFPEGGVWRVTRMKANPPGPKFTHWKKDDTASHEYLHIGCYGKTVSILAESTCPVGMHRALPRFEFLDTKTFRLSTGYYCPSSSCRATMDAFIYDEESKTATVIQAPTPETHGVKPKGIVWLRSLGVEKIQYVGVSSPGERLDLPFPNEWERAKLIVTKHLLVLQSVL